MRATTTTRAFVILFGTTGWPVTRSNLRTTAPKTNATNATPTLVRLLCFSCCCLTQITPGGGTQWGQNLFHTIKSCQDAYDGWVTHEAQTGQPMYGHFQNIVGFAADYCKMGCAVSNIKQGAIVCNYLLCGF
ncbi:hypothetical protein BC830DRAFT_1148093 [Chytriomyces sp. MP71]|nr:hypothetical protein BC830DRAFT_1148093 [Chytriomyces sp. MP71]